MPFQHTIEPLTGIRQTINECYRCDEADYITFLSQQGSLDKATEAMVASEASRLVTHVRSKRQDSSGIDSFLHEYSLNSEEGIALMCLAEALLRVPDKSTIDELIKDKLLGSDWKAHAGKSKSVFVNATTWALMLTGRLYDTSSGHDTKLTAVLKKLVSRTGEPVLRQAVAQAMKIMSKQFVMGRTINEALSRAKQLESQGYQYSYDMLGEAAMTEQDANRYMESYLDAIEEIGIASEGKGIKSGPGISIKLSALYPRYEVAHRKDALSILSKRLLDLCLKAKKFHIGLTVDAEEADRLDLSLDIIEKVASDKSLGDWEGFGLAVQSYQKRAFYVLDWVAQISKKFQRRMMVRLIKGAYWDTEIKQAQMEGLDNYPVFTFKSFTDVSFQACAKKLLTLTDYIYPQFATHNAYSVALVMTLAGDYTDYEFQCLHGMGQELYSAITPKETKGIPCRIYAPVGSHEDLLPYLVRRLLENGANSSFVNRIVDNNSPIEALISSPNSRVPMLVNKLGKAIPLPSSIFSNRLNSRGFDASDYYALEELSSRMKKYDGHIWAAGHRNEESGQHVYAPFDHSRVIGHVTETLQADVSNALESSHKGFKEWSEQTVGHRADILVRMGQLIESHKDEFYALLMLEAGKVLSDAVDEVREAIDFCYYYSEQARKQFSTPLLLEGYTGEQNILSYRGRGVMICISPWNFPLAIFLGQVAAALVAGNSVIAKPAEQTPLIANKATELLYEAGVPRNVMILLPGGGATIGGKLVSNPNIAGVMFTGSTQTARVINQALASRQGPIIPLVAETGGQNAMIIDSSALLEQVTQDVISSSFGSAGQRCSALRVLYVQDEIYDKFQEMLIGAMSLLKVGAPFYHETDVGPVIDNMALISLQKHVNICKAQGKLIYEVPMPKSTEKGCFLAPTLLAIETISELRQEQFGPILHMIRYKKNDIDQVIDEINGTDYGLTFGIHSRIEETIRYISERVHVGNCYVNRNMTGAVVGLQPFGGQGLSGTGPKAGGPNYLMRLCHEHTKTVDTTAAGGNASLMAKCLEED